MARSAEKAMTALARWRAAYVDKVTDLTKRPHFPSECESLKDATFFRRQIVHEISRKIAQIQNPSLGEYKLRDLNDEINKSIREKDRWDLRIKELGGPDYKADAPRLLEKDGKEAPGNRGYRYFGAARDLPGVRELFENQPQPIPRKTRGELMRCVDISYYGNCDEDDGVILPQEIEYEEKLIARKAAIWQRRRDDELAGRRAAYYRTQQQKEEDEEDEGEENPDEKDIYDTGDNPADTELLKLYSEIEKDCDVQKRTIESEVTVHASLAMALSSVLDEEKELNLEQLVNSSKVSDKKRLGRRLKRTFVTHAVVPSQEQIEAALVEQKKRQLLEQYMTPEFLSSISNTGMLLGVDRETAHPDSVVHGSSDEEDEVEDEDEVEKEVVEFSEENRIEYSEKRPRIEEP